MGKEYEKSLKCYYSGIESFQEGRYEEALELFYTSSVLHEHSRTYARIYECLTALHRRKEALPYIEKAYSMNKNQDKVALQYASELCEDKKFDEARLILEKILLRNQMYKPAKMLLEKCGI